MLNQVEFGTDTKIIKNWQIAIRALIIFYYDFIAISNSFFFFHKLRVTENRTYVNKKVLFSRSLNKLP